MDENKNSHRKITMTHYPCLWHYMMMMMIYSFNNKRMHTRVPVARNRYILFHEQAVYGTDTKKSSLDERKVK